jgi:DNA excision repair protein ERCC-3
MENHKILVVQSDKTILVESNSEFYPDLRKELITFAELIKTPEYYHTYLITKLSLWNAASIGKNAYEIIELLNKYCKFPIPASIQFEIQTTINSYGSCILEKNKGFDNLIFRVSDSTILEYLKNDSFFKKHNIEFINEGYAFIPYTLRGSLKQYLVSLGFPIKDNAGYTEGSAIEIELNRQTNSPVNKSFSLRPYQKEAIENFYLNGSPDGGSGSILLPCGAGKTIIGLGILAKIKQACLIICSNSVSVKQWINELLEKTSIEKSLIGEYSSDLKEIKPITLTTYQMLTYHKKEKTENNKEIISQKVNSDADESEFPHFNIFNEIPWGLIIYDEVHLLPAPIFRITANLQSIRRLGLTATLIREDGCENDVFSLIGPLRYTIPWSILEQQGWIAKAYCHEIRVPFDKDQRLKYLEAPKRIKYRFSAENPKKLEILDKLLEKHKKDSVLIIAQYIDQLTTISKRLNSLSIISGKTSTSKRIELYKKFESGEIQCLIVSKVANYAVNLPKANVLIQLSGTFGSRQEEAQRLGRILRPNPKDHQKESFFYSLVTNESIDAEYASHRQLFLVEQGYNYLIQDEFV